MAEQIACGADLGWCGASDAHALLDETDRVVGTNTQYSDGTWVYPWLWAEYVEKAGDTKFLAARFSSPGPLGASAQPSIEATAQIIAADRTGPGGIIGETNDIDANGYWVSDNYEALLGLAGYEYLAKVLGNTAQERSGGLRVVRLRQRHRDGISGHGRPGDSHRAGRHPVGNGRAGSRAGGVLAYEHHTVARGR